MVLITDFKRTLASYILEIKIPRSSYKGRGLIMLVLSDNVLSIVLESGHSSEDRLMSTDHYLVATWIILWGKLWPRSNEE